MGLRYRLEVAAPPRLDRKAISVDGEKGQLSATLGETSTKQPDGRTNRRGVYEAWLSTKENVTHVRRYALNVDTAESNLTIVSPEGLLARLGELELSYIAWDQVNPKPLDQQGFSLSRILLIVLICMLIAEQIMAYSISYHPARRNRRSRTERQTSYNSPARGGVR